MSLQFTSLDIPFRLKNRRLRRSWLLSVLSDHGFQCGDISLVFVSDSTILEMNKTYLSHDYYTDILTFGEAVDGVVSADLVISIDTVRSNAVQWGSTFTDELDRVMAHGLLHLVGYDDTSDDTRTVMRAKEDFYLSTRTFL